MIILQKLYLLIRKHNIWYLFISIIFFCISSLLWVPMGSYTSYNNAKSLTYFFIKCVEPFCTHTFLFFVCVMNKSKFWHFTLAWKYCFIDKENKFSIYLSDFLIDAYQQLILFDNGKHKKDINCANCMRSRFTRCFD